MKRIFLQLLLMLSVASLFAHTKARFHVIVDTDGGNGDMRALCMMLADPEIEVIAITAVDGTLSPERTIARVKSLLHTLGHEGIPVGGKSTDEAAEMILHETEMEEMPVDIVALGPLDNVTEAIGRLPGSSEKIRTIYWAFGDTRYGWITPETVLGHPFIRMYFVRTEEELWLDIDAFQEGLEKIGSRYADAVAAQQLQAPSTGADREASFRLLEEVAPMYMLHPEHFELQPMNDEGHYREARLRSDSSVVPEILRILDGEQEDKSIVFKHFPTDTSLFEPDVAALAPDILKRHGEKEWKIVVITNEFHEHLGIYSIVGAKMGLRAREYFNVGIDELTILSYAGLSPPLSCMNDGLQASTGATLGHGTIKVSPDVLFPAAEFRFKDRQLKLSVKEEVRNEIREHVKYGVDTFGFETPAYWEYIRSLALKYWLDFSRFELFDAEESF